MVNKKQGFTKITVIPARVRLNGVMQDVSAQVHPDGTIAVKPTGQDIYQFNHGLSSDAQSRIRVKAREQASNLESQPASAQG